jgi:hypothetical protein
MFDINPDAHAHYLSNLERTYADCARRPAPDKKDRPLPPRRMTAKAVSITLTLVLITALSGAPYL